MASDDVRGALVVGWPRHPSGKESITTPQRNPEQVLETHHRWLQAHPHSGTRKGGGRPPLRPIRRRDGPPEGGHRSRTQAAHGGPGRVRRRRKKAKIVSPI